MNVNDVLAGCMDIDGALGAALVDHTSGMTLGVAGGAGMNLEMAAAGNTELVRAKMRTIAGLGLKEDIEDILVTLGETYHLIRLVGDHDSLFLYLVLNKDKANLAMARYRLLDLEKQFDL